MLFAKILSIWLCVKADESWGRGGGDCRDGCVNCVCVTVELVLFRVQFENKLSHKGTGTNNIEFKYLGIWWAILIAIFPRGYGEKIIEEKFSIALHIRWLFRILESVLWFFRRILQLITCSPICVHLLQLVKEPSKNPKTCRGSI